MLKRKNYTPLEGAFIFPPFLKEGGRGASSMRGDQGALTIRPDLMQLVHTKIFRTLPFLMDRIRWRFGLNLRLFTLCAWLTWQPVMGFFPHISQIFDIFTLLVITLKKMDCVFYTKSVLV